MILEGMIINGISFEFGGKVAFATITQKMINDSGAAEETMDDIAAIPGQIEGRVRGHHDLKNFRMGSAGYPYAQFRTSTQTRFVPLSVEGGHVLASGCGIYAPASEAKKKLINAMREIWGL